MSHQTGTKCQSWNQVYCHSWCEQCDWRCVILIAQMSAQGRASCSPLTAEPMWQRCCCKQGRFLPQWSVKHTFEGFERPQKQTLWPKWLRRAKCPSRAAPVPWGVSADVLPSQPHCVLLEQLRRIAEEIRWCPDWRSRVDGRALLGSLPWPCAGTVCEASLSQILTWPPRQKRR